MSNVSDIREKIMEFYKPELKYRSGAVIEVKGKKKAFFAGQNQKVFLTFGENISTEQEAREKGGYETTYHELFILLFPEAWKNIQHLYEDERTEAFLKGVRDNIGLISIEHGWDEENFEIVDSYKTWINLTGSGNVDVGIVADGRWVAQFALRTAIDDYDITRMYFLNKPSNDDVKTAALTEDIALFFAGGNYDQVYFNCKKCGKSTHWIDIQSDSLARKWNAFKEQYCGC